MQVLKRFVEWYLGIPPAEPGQGAPWSFSYALPWPDWLPGWIALLLGVAVVGAVGWIYLRDAKTAPLVTRAALIGLRVAAIGLLLVFLSGLTLSVGRTDLPIVVVLIDDSASMRLDDHYPDKGTAAKARQLLADGRFETMTRLNLVKSVLTRHDGEFLRQLLEGHKLHVYRFSETAVSLDRGEYVRSEEIDELVSLLRDRLEPEGDKTRPGPAVAKVLANLRGTPPSAVVIFTDGITTTSDDDRLTRVVDVARDKSVPIYTVGVGSEEPARDLEISGLLAPEVAFVDDPITFTADLKTYGAKGKSVVVRLRHKDAPQILASRTVRAGENGHSQKVELTHSPPDEGEFDYVLEAVPLEGETNTGNNTQFAHVSVRQERLRVLLADSASRREFRFVKHLLEREKTVELHTVLQDADVEYAAEDETARPLEGRFPVGREQLFRYDVVILGDVDPGTLHADVFQNLHDFVRQGGGLILVAGPFYNPLSYRGTLLEPLLPVQLEGAKAPPPNEIILDGFRPQLTIDGLNRGGIFRFAETEQQSREVWNSLPELYWLFEAPELKPGAVVFAEHPSRTAKSADGARRGRKLPVIVMQRFGAGKVVFHATDDLWNWRFRVGDLYYGRYWIQTIRDLCRSKLLGRSRTAELESDRKVYQQGDTAQLTLRFFDETATPVEDDGVTVVVEHRAAGRRELTLSRVPGLPAVFQGRLERVAQGSYHAWVAAPTFRTRVTEDGIERENEAPPPACDFTVEAPGRELQVRNLDRPELEQTARETHGAYYSITEADRLPDEIPVGVPVPLEKAHSVPVWNRWELMLLFALLLTGEWLLRKRLRLV